MSTVRHKCNKPKTSSTFSAEWSGVSFAPHAPYIHVKCGERLHNEDGELYCPACDDHIGALLQPERLLMMKVIAEEE